MKLRFQIENIQHVKSMNFHVDLASPRLICIVGKNGTGKTTLIKAIQNLCVADTFSKTSAISIFRKDSKVTYEIDDQHYAFSYDDDLRSLNSKIVIPVQIKQSISVELPMPYGQRFNFFQKIWLADGDIRTQIVLENYVVPKRLISFLKSIYSSDKFKNLIEVKIKETSYYCILLENSRYIREDYLSSGEYFLLSLYRKIIGGNKLIVVDEIDISLDAAAQANLIKELRLFCTEFNVSVIFTTHSLAMMKTLNEEELLYMEEDGGIVTTSYQSYNSVKSLLFGFRGWDKYILTEDDRLQEFLQFLITRYEVKSHYQFKIIYVGGGQNVTDLMNRNSREGFLSLPKNVISILDGDQKEFWHARDKVNVYCIPIESVEKHLYSIYLRNAQLLPALSEEESQKIMNLEEKKRPKELWTFYRRTKKVPADDLYKFVCESEEDLMVNFVDQVVRQFLEKPEAIAS